MIGTAALLIIMEHNSEGLLHKTTSTVAHPFRGIDSAIKRNSN